MALNYGSLLRILIRDTFPILFIGTLQVPLSELTDDHKMVCLTELGNGSDSLQFWKELVLICDKLIDL